jgi:hypothetical protein
MSRRAAHRKGGPPRKAPEGLNKALFIRANSALLDRLDELCEQEKKRRPGIVLSRADVARSILWDAINRSGKDESK